MGEARLQVLSLRTYQGEGLGTDQLESALKDKFNLESFRLGQREIIEAVVRGDDAW